MNQVQTSPALVGGSWLRWRIALTRDSLVTCCCRPGLTPGNADLAIGSLSALVPLSMCTRDFLLLSNIINGHCYHTGLTKTSYFVQPLNIMACITPRH